jgi:hypothetical protein
MAKLTESYLKGMIKQVMKEGLHTPSGSPRTTEDSIFAALFNTGKHLEEALLHCRDNPRAKQYIDQAIEEIMFIEEMLGEGLRGGLEESRKPRTLPKRK